MTVRIGFFKGPGTWADNLIRWWTRSAYSHVKLRLDGYDWAGVDLVALKVVRSSEIRDEREWDYVEVALRSDQYAKIDAFIDRTEGAGYDWTGILLSQVLPLARHDKNRWFCSEWIVRAFQDAGVLDPSLKAQAFSPQDVYRLFRDRRG